jgi:hypothetical protein
VVRWVAKGSEVLDKPIVPGITTCAAVGPLREQRIVLVETVKHEGRILMVPHCEDDNLEAIGMAWRNTSTLGRLAT